MKRQIMVLSFLAALIALVATGCGGESSAPQLGETGKDTFVFIYTDN